MSDCKHESPVFDRTICPEPCGSMHNYCGDCGELLDDCPHLDECPHTVPVPATERALDAALATIRRLEARLAEARAENDELRSLCADELAREGQKMGLDDD